MAEVKKLGDMLKEAGLIDDFQLQSALSHQRNWGGKLGAILIDLEFVKEEDLSKVIAEKLRIPYINLFEPEIQPEVIKMVKPETVRKYHVIPVKKEEKTLILAMLDPLDIEAMDEVRFTTGLKIKPSLAMESEIKDAIKKYYDGVEVVRNQSKTPFRKLSSGGMMDITSGSDHTMLNQGTSEAASLPSGEYSVRQSPEDSAMRLDALITLLIEKNVIQREELFSMIQQKKVGL